DLAGADVEVDAVDGGEALVAFDEPGDLDDRAAGRGGVGSGRAGLCHGASTRGSMSTAPHHTPAGPLPCSISGATRGNPPRGAREGLRTTGCGEREVGKEWRPPAPGPLEREQTVDFRVAHREANPDEHGQRRGEQEPGVLEADLGGDGAAEV